MDTALETPAQVKKPRFATPQKLRDIYEACRRGDEPAALQRAKIRLEFSGRLPWDDNDENNPAKRGGLNINFNEGEAQIREQALELVALIWEPEYPARFNLKSEVEGGFAQRQNWARAIADKFKWLIKRGWKSAFYQYCHLAHEYVEIGVCFQIHGASKSDFTWVAHGLDDVKIHQKTKAVMADITFVGYIDRWSAHKIAEKYLNPAEGWSKPMLKQCLMNLSNLDTSTKGMQFDPEEYARAIQDQAFFYDSSSEMSIQILRGIYVESDGSVSSAMCAADGLTLRDGEEEFIFKGEKYADSIDECLTLFISETGSKDIQSIRGAGHRMHDTALYGNQALSIAITDQLRAGGAMWKCSEEDYINCRTKSFGSDMLVTEDVEVAPKPYVDTSASVLAMRGLLAQVQESSARIVSQRGVDSGNQVRSASEMNIIQQMKQRASNLNNLFFLVPVGRGMESMYRRAVDPNQDPETEHGRIALEFQKRILQAGVPDMVMRNGVDSVEAYNFGGGMDNIPIGELVNLLAVLPVQAKPMVLGNILARYFGWDAVMEILGETGLSSRGAEMKIPMLETIAMAAGNEVLVIPSEPHIEHLLVHVEDIAASRDRVMTEMEKPDGNPVQTMLGLANLLLHMQSHIAQAEAQNPKPPELAAIGEAVGAGMNALKQLGSSVKAYMEAKQARDMQKQQVEPQQDAQNQIAMDRWQTEKQIILDRAEVEKNLMIEKQRIQNEGAELRTVQKLQAEGLKTASKIDSQVLEQATQP